MIPDLIIRTTRDDLNVFDLWTFTLNHIEKSVKNVKNYTVWNTGGKAIASDTTCNCSFYKRRFLIKKKYIYTMTITKELVMGHKPITRFKIQFK